MQRALGRLGVNSADTLTLDTDAWRATLTDAAAQARALHDAMSRVAGEHGQLIAVGGWLRSAAFVAVKRQFFGPLLRPVVEEAGARGAALLAGVAAGAYPDVSRLPVPAMEQL
jgi:sugar (pentulose or hexulose) kinase